MNGVINAHYRELLKTKENISADYDYHLRIKLGLAAKTVAGIISKMRRMIKFV
jgi:hypothetical protein